MAFNESMGVLARRASRELKTRRAVCELGNQTFRARKTAQAAGIQCDTTDEYYKRLGFGSYVCIDINERMGALAMDLNCNLAEHYGYRERFSLVTNNGTGEHLIDQRSVFRNAHELCEVGGIMLHQLPFSGWWNHGFYCLQPTLFVDLAASNGYELVFCGVCAPKGGHVDLSPEDFAAVVKGPDDALPLARAMKQIGPNVNVYCALRKKSEGDFKLPIQGKYVRDIESGEIASRYL